MEYLLPIVAIGAAVYVVVKVGLFVYQTYFR